MANDEKPIWTKEGDLYVARDGSQYETLWRLHHFATLGMCGCGDPEGAYNFLRDILKLADRRGTHATPPTREWIYLAPEVEKLVAANPAMAAHVLLHFLTDKDVLEHGGSVGGSWLTDMGNAIVDGEPATEEEDDG